MHRNVGDQGKLRSVLAMRKRQPGDFRVALNKASDEADVYLFSEIGFWGVTADEFAREMQQVDAKTVRLHLNSPGGDAWDGQAIYHTLREHPAAIEVRVEGIAASAASTIALAADPGRLLMAKHAMMMIHDPWTITVGDARDHQKTQEVLDRLGDAIAGFYADRAGGSAREWRDRMLEETWYSDQEAVDAGLADGIVGDEAPANAFDLSVFRNTPKHLLGPSDDDGPVTKRDAERALRDAGLPVAAAKLVIARGWDGLDARDERALRELADHIRGLTR